LGVGIQDTIITEFIGINHSVTAFLSAGRCATITVLVVAIIALFTEQVVGDSVTAVRMDAIDSASVGQVGVQQSLITELFGINDTIPTMRVHAIGSAAVREVIIVHWSVVALLHSESSVRECSELLDSISALACGRCWEIATQNWLQERTW